MIALRKLSWFVPFTFLACSDGGGAKSASDSGSYPDGVVRGDSSVSLSDGMGVACPNPEHTPGGPDQLGGCWPFEGNSGVPEGVTLTNYDGPCTITEATEIDSKTIECDLVVKAPLTVTRSVVNGHIDGDYGEPLTITDSEVHAGKTSAPAIGYSNITVRRCEVTGGQHSILCGDNCVAEDNWLHDQYNAPGEAFHNNAYISNGGSNHLIRHNSLFCSPENNNSGGGCTADASIFGDFAVMTDVVFEKNLFLATPSGGYCGTFGHNPAKPFGDEPANITVRANVFQRGGNNKCGTNGPVTSFLSDNGNVWDGNRWDDGETMPPADD